MYVCLNSSFSSQLSYWFIISQLYNDLQMMQSYIRKLENANHFDNGIHHCNEDCEFFKNEIAFCARKLVIPPQHRFHYEVIMAVLLCQACRYLYGS